MRHTSFLLIVAVLVLIFVTATNFLEHTGIYPGLDKYEDFIELLFYPVFIFGIFSTLITKELRSRILNQNRLNGILDQSGNFIGLLDKTGRLIEANQTALQFINKKGDDVLGNYFWDTPWWNHSEIERNKIKDAFEKAMKGNVVKMEVTHIGANGQHIIVDFSLTPVLNADHEIEYLIPEGRDITNIKKAEKMLQNYNYELEDIVKKRTKELERNIDYQKNLNDELNHKNEELKAINEEIINKQHYIQELLKENENTTEELKKINKDLSHKKQLLENVLADLHSTQEQLIQNEKMASLGILTAGIAHELKNPINFISSGVSGLKVCLSQISEGYSELLASLEQLDNATINSLKTKIENKHNISRSFKGFEVLSENIHHGVNRTVEIINSLRTYIHSNNHELVNCNLDHIIESNLKILQHEYKNKIQINRLIDSRCIVKGNSGKLNQLFLNIIANAIQAIENEGLINIKGWLDEKTNNVIITISDNGMGMNDETIKQIFDPFFTTKALGKGTGLGLSISYNIVKEHNGEILVTSALNEGSEFKLTFPVYQ